MFRNTFQKSLFPIFRGAGLDPLKNWKVQRRAGYMKRIYEPDSGILVLEMRTLNSTLHYISCPKDTKKTLGIGMPIFNLLIKNLNKCFSFEITIMDDSRMRRRFRCGNFITCCSVQMFATTIPLTMSCCEWVLIYFNLAEFTRRSYNTNYLETERVKINGNIHLREVFFSDRIIDYCDLPKDYQILSTEQKKPVKKLPPVARPPSAMTQKRMSTKVKVESVSELDVSAQQSPKSPISPKSVASLASLSPSKIPSGDIKTEPPEENSKAVGGTTEQVTVEDENTVPKEEPSISKQGSLAQVIE